MTSKMLLLLMLMISQVELIVISDTEKKTIIEDTTTKVDIYGTNETLASAPYIDQSYLQESGNEIKSNKSEEYWHLVNNEEDFTLSKCCPNKDILSISSDGKPECKNTHNFSSTQSSIKNIDKSNIGIPKCINGFLTVIDKLIESSEDKTIANADEFCNDISITNGSLPHAQAVVCKYPLIEKCETKPESCISLCCKQGHICKQPSKLHHFKDKIFVANDHSDFVEDQNITIKSDGVYVSKEPIHGSTYLSIDVKLTLNDYCIDIDNIDDDTTLKGAVNKSKLKQEEHSRLLNIRDMFLVLIFISVVSLFLCILVHIIEARLRNSLFTWMKIGHMFSFMFTYIIICIRMLFGKVIQTQYPAICQLLAFAQQFFNLATFFWINVMSFDIWRTLRRFRGFSIHQQSRINKQRRFIYYAIYAWGSSLTILVVTIMMQYLPQHMTGKLIKPNIGVEACFLQSGWSSVVYYTGTVFLLLMVNNVFFLLSSWALKCGVWACTATDRHRMKTKQRYSVQIELCFVMGVPWTLKIIWSWLLATQPADWVYRDALMFIDIWLIDVPVALQGFLILLIVLLKLKCVKKFLHSKTSSILSMSTFSKRSNNSTAKT